MKKSLFVFALLVGISALKSQTNLSRVTIQYVDTTLQVNSADTSYLFQAYVLTQLIGGVDTVKLSAFNYLGNGQWMPAMDTLYVWSQVNDSLGNLSAYNIYKQNDNLLLLNLGRLYYSVRKRYVFILSGSNGIYTKEFIF